ncbi:MAG: hypothetical protein KGL39_17815 [Patescibacteria group bacterium]|nr:hypothetical protein [Patescibacteria group bacterium]
MSLPIDQIADRLEEAAHTLKRMPAVSVQGYISSWPVTVNDYHESYGYNSATVHLGPPSARHISEMDEVFAWIAPLPLDDKKLLWMRALRVRWKKIARLRRCSVRTAQNHWQLALLKIVYRLQKI